MIVCVCNRINCSQVREAIACGANSAPAVLAVHGKRFNCGRCRDHVEDMLGEALSCGGVATASSGLMTAAE